MGAYGLITKMRLMARKGRKASPNDDSDLFFLHSTARHNYRTFGNVAHSRIHHPCFSASQLSGRRKSLLFVYVSNKIHQKVVRLFSPALLPFFLSTAFIQLQICPIGLRFRLNYLEIWA